VERRLSQLKRVCVSYLEGATFHFCFGFYWIRGGGKTMGGLSRPMKNSIISPALKIPLSAAVDTKKRGKGKEVGGSWGRTS